MQLNIDGTLNTVNTKSSAKRTKPQMSGGKTLEQIRWDIFCASEPQYMPPVIIPDTPIEIRVQQMLDYKFYTKIPKK